MRSAWGCLRWGYLSALLLAVAILLPPARPIRRTTKDPVGAGRLMQAAALGSYGKLPLNFEANLGQADRRVRFLSRGAGYTLFLTDSEAVLQIRDRNCGSQEAGRAVRSLATSAVREPRHCSASAVRMKLDGANPSPQIVPHDELPGRSNYFIGGDPSRWRTNVPTYGKVEYRNVYPGVNLVYYGNQRQLEYDFVVAPGADPRQIRLAMQGADKAEVDNEGNLILRVNDSTLRFHKPVVYQESSGRRKEIAGRYAFRGKREVGFEVTSYDTSRPLVIDPKLVYSTYLGGSGNDQPGAVAVDSAGNAYVAGSTLSSNFPTASALQSRKPSSGDFATAFVAKLNAAGSALVYSTYLGGSSWDSGSGIAVDAAGNAYVAGSTKSPDFPTVNALQATLRGQSNAFVAKLNATGSALVYSTYLGGSGADYGIAIAVDSAGSAYLTGATDSTNFPTTNPLQSTYGGGMQDAFLAKLSPAGSTLVYSTYLGGTGVDSASSIAVDAIGNACVTGATDSTNFPAVNALQSSLRGKSDAFVTKVNASGSALVYSTYLGGSLNDGGSGIAVDPAGNAYVAGTTDSADFPMAKAVQVTLGGSSDAFVAKLNPAGSALIYSTYLGGSGSDGASGIAVDSTGNAYVAGSTVSTNFPTASPLQPACGGGTWGCADAFVAKISAGGAALLYSTYLGGKGDDSSYGIAVDATGNAYVVGWTGSVNFPIANALQPIFGGTMDAFVTKIMPVPAVKLSIASLAFGEQSVGTTAPPQSSTLMNSGDATLNITGLSITGTNAGDFAQTNTCGTNLAAGTSCTITITFSPTGTGARTASVAITDSASGSPHTITLAGTGIITVVKLSATSLTFSNQAVGTSAAQTVTLTNSGTATLNIASIAITGTNSGDFSQSNTCGASVAAAARCTISVTFTPTATGPRTASVSITDNATASPQTVALTGTGITAPALTLTPTQLMFLQTAGTASAPQTVTLTNSGTATLNIASIWIKVAVTPDFTLTTTCGASLAVGASCSTSTIFSPMFVRQWYDTLVIDDNATGSPHQIPLFGAATAGAGPKPVIGALANAASYRLASCVPTIPGGSDCQPYSPPAPGTIVTLFGQYLADSTQTATALPLPTMLGGAVIGLPPSLPPYSTLPAFLLPLLYVSPTQINFVLRLDGDPTHFPIFRNGISSADDLFIWAQGPASGLAPFSPGIFSANATGSGQGAVVIAGTSSMAAPIGMLPGSRPAARGEYVEIYCTGLGAVTNPPVVGKPALASPLSNTVATPVVTIGGALATVQFSGLAPGYVGLYQVNVQVPDGTPTDDAVPIVITMTDSKGQKYPSNEVSIAVQ